MPRPRRPLTAEETARLEAFYAKRPLPLEMFDPEERTITLWSWEGLLGALIAIVAMPLLWVVLTLCVVIFDPSA